MAACRWSLCWTKFVICTVYLFIYFCRNINFGSIAHLLSHSMATGVQGHFLGVKGPVHEIDLSFPSNAKVKNKCSYTPLRLYSVNWENFTFTLFFH